MGLFFSTSQDPSAFIDRIRGRITPQTQDIELIAEEQKTRIIQRTARGVDFEERAFQPYSTKGPYYWYPNGRGTRTSGRQATILQGKAKRFLAKLNAGRGTPIGEITPGGGIKFESYAAFKQALRGYSFVDLMGPRAPLMMASILKMTTGPLEVRIGIYDAEKARIAQGHQNGNSRGLPRRPFFGISEADKLAMKNRLADILRSRL